MKVLLINDSHIGHKRSNRVFEEHILSSLEDIIQYCVENDIKRIAGLGDFFDTRTSLNMISLEAVKARFFNRLLELGIEVDMIPGNHDLSFRHSVKANSVDMVLREYSNVRVYNEPTVVNLPDGTNFLMVPWIGKDDEAQFLKMIDEAVHQTHICMGHFEFKGFLYQQGMMASEGMESSIFTPKFDLILSGHYHSKSKSGNVVYLGSQYDLTWADYDEKKFWHVLDTQTNELTEVENPRKMFFKIFYDESFVDKEFLGQVRKTDYSNKIVKIVVLNRKNMVTFDNFMDVLYSHGPYEVSVIDESITKVKEEIKVDTSVLTKSTLEIIDSLLAECDLEGYDLDKIKHYMHQFYRVAESTC